MDNALFDENDNLKLQLEVYYDEAISRRDMLTAIRLKRVLRNRRLFFRLMTQLKEKHAQTASETPFLDWLLDGGWEVILELILNIIERLS